MKILSHDNESGKMAGYLSDKLPGRLKPEFLIHVDSGHGFFKGAVSACRRRWNPKLVFSGQEFLAHVAADQSEFGMMISRLFY